MRSSEAWAGSSTSSLLVLLEAIQGKNIKAAGTLG
jgi:hypothetical protein